MLIFATIKDYIDGLLANINTKSCEHVERALDEAAAGNPEKLNWRTSITDLLKLCGLASDFATRKHVAEEFGMADYSGKAEENVKLHGIIFDDLRKGGIDLPRPSGS